jgi:2,4-dienoyl-CoA reductase-like NADH-dependent reductase (Old Yellow Enzyme family)/alpha-beta hydrolase superfamily lysophospholipase
MSELLFTPASIGGVTIPNRLVRSATIDCMCPEPGVLSDSYLELYERLARGGAGLIITGNYFVHARGVAQPRILVVDSDAVLPELAKLIAIVKRHGALIFGQLNHGGRYCKPSYIGGEQPLAPSAARDMINKTVPRPMTEQEIETVIDAYASAAARLERAGFDGVEINATHGYLVNQFLSARTNWRKDAWGGTLENRFRFLEEIVRRIHGRTRFPVTVKISGQDYIPRGVTLRESILLAQKLESLGVSGLTISGGLKESPFTTMDKGDVPRRLILRDRKGFERVRGQLFVMMQKRGARFSEAYFLDDAAAIRAAVSIPVTAVGGFRSVEVMEKALADGHADFIGMSRPFIREPDLPRRLRGGGLARATCVNCNLCLIKTVLRYDPVACYWKKGVSRTERDGAPAVVEDRLRTSDGFSLFYRGTFPAKSTAAVIFLHGMSEHSGMYLHVIQALGAAGITVLAPDQRGRGQSVGGRWRRGDLHSVARVLRDLDELRTRHRIELDGRPVFVVAVSMGSLIAQRYARELQGSLAGVVLVGPPYGVPSGTSPALLAFSSILAALAPRLPIRPAPLISAISRERGVQWELECDPYCYHGPLRARAGRQLAKSLRLLEGSLGGITLPLLIQYGTGDLIVSRREVQEIHDRWGGQDRTLTVMDGPYHDVLNEPERYQAIDEIIAWIGARAGKQAPRET